ncbi:MAG: exosortase-dependent surface protein XDP2 [Cyanobacteria bacterium P01_F01_bin.150]
MSTMPAHAVGFSFTSECIDSSGNVSNAVCLEQAPYKDIILESVRYGGQSRSDLTLVDRAVIVNNEVWTGGEETGAASADRGTEATLGLVEENVTAEQIANADPSQQSVLTNRNLNSIVDTEDKGKFAIDLFFKQAVDNILLWERGMNSALRIQAIDGDGNLVGNDVKLGILKPGNQQEQEDFTPWYDAGFDISTTEIAQTKFPTQRVGSLGINKSDFGLLEDERVTGIRLISEGEKYNGPDWKVMGTIDPRYSDPEDVPEPFALLGLIVVGGAIASHHHQE